MKTSISIISLTLLSLIILSCRPQKIDPRLAEAHEYHQQAGQIRENLNQQLADMEGDNLTLITVQEFKRALEDWDEAWVEVPGFEHDHDHDHEEEGNNHHHHHIAAPNLSTDEHLELQKHLLKEIKQLKNSFNVRRKVLAK